VGAEGFSGGLLLGGCVRRSAPISAPRLAYASQRISRSSRHDRRDTARAPEGSRALARAACAYRGRRQWWKLERLADVGDGGERGQEGSTAPGFVGPLIRLTVTRTCGAPSETKGAIAAVILPPAAR
jgi:hypothetical protein